MTGIFTYTISFDLGSKQKKEKTKWYDLLFSIKWGYSLRGRDVLPPTNTKCSFAMARIPKQQINFLTNRFLVLLKGGINEWSHQTLRKFVVHYTVPKKKWEIIRPERMAIYLLYSQARFCRKRWQLVPDQCYLKKSWHSKFSTPFLDDIFFFLSVLKVTNFSPAENTAASQKNCITKLISINPRGIRDVVIRLLYAFPLSKCKLPEGLIAEC